MPITDAWPFIMCSIFNHCWSVGYVSLLTFSLIHNLFVFLNLFKTFHIPWERVSVDMALIGSYRLTSLNLAWTGLRQESVACLCQYPPPSLRKLNLSGCRENITDQGNTKLSGFKFCKQFHLHEIQLALVIIRVDLTCIYTRA